jgi:hypothetical protein
MQLKQLVELNKFSKEIQKNPARANIYWVDARAGMVFSIKTCLIYQQKTTRNRLGGINNGCGFNNSRLKPIFAAIFTLKRAADEQIKGSNGSPEPLCAWAPTARNDRPVRQIGCMEIASRGNCGRLQYLRRRMLD